MLRGFLLTLFLVVTVAAQVPLGATKSEVIEKLGWPKSTSGTDEREIMNYPEYSVLLVDGKVVSLEFKPRSNKLPNTYTPPPTRAAPQSAPKTTPATLPVRKVPTPAPVTPEPVKATEAIRPAQVIPIAAPTQVPANQVQASRLLPPTLPRPDPFAGIKNLLLWMGLILGGILVLKFATLANRRRKAEEARITRSDSPLLPPLLKLKTSRPAMPARPDPLTEGWSLALLKEIEWHRFEHLVAAYERELGNDAELTGFGADGGIDVQVFADGSRSLKRVIQCKAYDNQKVGVELVRAFFGAMTLQKVPHGAFYTTSGFTDDALAIGRENSSLELVDGPTFLNRIQRMQLSAQLRLFEVATEGDYTTPTCPSCGVKMILRTAGKGRSEGNTFYGCRNYPRCKQTFKISQPD